MDLCTKDSSMQIKISQVEVSSTIQKGKSATQVTGKTIASRDLAFCTMKGREIHNYKQTTRISL